MSVDEKQSRPEWMPEASEAERWHRAVMMPELAVAHARYRKRFKEAENFHLAVTAFLYDECRNFDEWRSAAENYNVPSLADEQPIKKSNGAVAARAINLKAAIPRLLVLAGAPPAMIADAEALLAPLCPAGAEQRARAQEIIVKHPHKGVRAAANEAKTSPGQISRDRHAGLLVMSPTGVWSTSD